MKFKEVVEEMGLENLAEKIDLHPNTLRNYALGKFQPRVVEAFKIEKATKGKITAKQIAEEYEQNGK